MIRKEGVFRLKIKHLNDIYASHFNMREKVHANNPDNKRKPT